MREYIEMSLLAIGLIMAIIFSVVCSVALVAVNFVMLIVCLLLSRWVVVPCAVVAVLYLLTIGGYHFERV